MVRIHGLYFINTCSINRLVLLKLPFVEIVNCDGLDQTVKDQTTQSATRQTYHGKGVIDSSCREAEK